MNASPGVKALACVKACVAQDGRRMQLGRLFCVVVKSSETDSATSAGDLRVHKIQGEGIASVHNSPAW